MAKAEKLPRQVRPARNPANREKQLINMAYDSMEQRMLDGTVSSAELVYLAKQGSPKMQLELENLRMQNQLIQAKIESLDSERMTADAYDAALAAMKGYQPTQTDDAFIEGEFREM